MKVTTPVRKQDKKEEKFTPTRYSHAQLVQLESDRALLVKQGKNTRIRLFAKQVKKSRFTFTKDTESFAYVDLSDMKDIQEVVFESTQPNLVYLDLGRCNISKIKIPAGCDKLQTLYLHGNGLQEITFEGDCPALELLDLSKNNLSKLQLPYAFERLHFLYLDNNPLKKLSDLHHFFDRDGFDFSFENNDALEEPPQEIVQKSKRAIVNYFKEIAKEEARYLFETKVLIIGEGGVGKTSFARRMQNPKALLPKDKDTTLGIDVKKWIFDVAHRTRGEQTMYANLWDFGGQQIYQGTHQIFFSSKSFYVLLHDTREEKTDFAYWLNTVEQLAGDDSKLLIVQNKKHEHVSKLDKNALLGRFGDLIVGFSELDIKHEADQVLALQEKLKQYLLDLPNIGDKLPASWVRIHKVLYDLQDNFISYDRYLEICRKEKANIQELDLLSDYFNRIGVFTHYYDDSVLKQRVFLNSNWLVNSVYEVLNHQTVKSNNGRITASELQQIWRGDTLYGEIDYLSRLMQRFGLMYQSDAGNYIVPAHLPKEQPYTHWKHKTESDVLQFTYEFDRYMPRGILPRIIVALHQRISNQALVWSSGVNIEYENSYAEIKEPFDQPNTFFIRIVGDKRKELLGIIRNEFEKLLEPYTKLKYEELIPCTCFKCKNTTSPFFYKKSVLEKRKADKKWTIECENSYEDVKVLALLDGVFGGGDKEPKEDKKETIQKLLDKGEIKSALEEFLKVSKNTKWNSDVSTQLMLFNMTKKDFNTKIIDYAEFSLTRARINHAILDFLEDFEW